MAHTGRNRPGGALSHLIPVDPWSVSHTIERIVARTQRLDRKPHPNSTYDAHTVPETIAHERPPRRHLGPMLLSSRRTRGGLRHIQKLFAAGGVEDDDVLGGPPPRGELLDPLPPADQRSAAKEQGGSFRAPHGLDDERDRLIELAAYHRVKLESKVPAKPKSVA
jgi:hypothetical protein